jgi:hypothetical protein
VVARYDIVTLALCNADRLDRARFSSADFVPQPALMYPDFGASASLAATQCDRDAVLPRLTRGKPAASHRFWPARVGLHNWVSLRLPHEDVMAAIGSDLLDAVQVVFVRNVDSD